MVSRRESHVRERVITLLARLSDRLLQGVVRTQPSNSGSISSILVIKPCCLGDVLMATPALRALRRTFPTATIHVLTTAWCAEALRNNPQVDGVFRYPDTLTIVRYLRLAHRIRRRHYDLGISLDRSPLVNALLLFGGVAERAGIDSANRGIGLTHRVAPSQNQHETELYLAVAKSVGAVAEDSTPDYHPSDDAMRTAARLIDHLQRPVVVIHPGGAVNPGSTFVSKRWPPEFYGELASELVHRHGASIVVVGAESDADVVQGAIDFTDAIVTDLSTKLTIPELAAVCDRAQLYVGNDSGMSHLASAVGTPTVTIFGPTSPALYRPLGPDAEVCTPPGSKYAPAGRDLRRRMGASERLPNISDVTVEEVLQVCERLLVHADAAGD